MVNKNTDNLASELMKFKNQEKGIEFEVQPIPGEVEVLQIFIKDQEELPVNLTIAGEEILCMVNLFKKDEVKDEMQGEMNAVMLAMNIPMPLSSFATMGDKYVVFGSLSANSSIEDIVREIETLGENSIEAIKALQDFLK